MPDIVPDISGNTFEESGKPLVSAPIIGCRARIFQEKRAELLQVRITVEKRELGGG